MAQSYTLGVMLGITLGLLCTVIFPCSGLAEVEANSCDGCTNNANGACVKGICVCRQGFTGVHCESKTTQEPVPEDANRRLIGKIGYVAVWMLSPFMVLIGLLFTIHYLSLDALIYHPMAQEYLEFYGNNWFSCFIWNSAELAQDDEEEEDLDNDRYVLDNSSVDDDSFLASNEDVIVN